MIALKNPLAFILTTGLAACGLITVPMSAQIPPEALQAAAPPENSIWVDSLDLANVLQGYGTAQAGRSVGNNPLTLGKVVYQHGVGTHSAGKMVIDLHGAATYFMAVVGLDDEVAGKGSVAFGVWVDGKKLKQTNPIRIGAQKEWVSVNLTGAQKLVLVVGDGGDDIQYDHADWAGALLILAPGAAKKPETVAIEQEVPRYKMVAANSQPAIHGARIIGSTPKRFFLYSIAAMGAGPLAFTASGLPDGLKLNGSTGIITGSLQSAGTTKVGLTVTGPGGTAHRDLTIVGSDHKLSLTPPMGWNSWNVWGDTVDEGKVKDAANEMISVGLAAHGYQYVNIDEGWQGKGTGAALRDPQGNILSNAQFPDMKGLSDFVHAKGLRVGLYSSPGPATCGGYIGSYQHEDQDAKTYAEWGFDYLKYDWCSYGGIPHSSDSVDTMKKPYQVMREALNKVDRDIVYSLCQYGMGDVWKWASHPDVDGNCWRTHGDIQDYWTSLYDIIENEVGHEKFASPGHWNDPDMLMVGIVGFGNTHPTRLTPNEQITHVSMWCMFSSPLLIGCDMTKFDPFTLALLTNDELIEINQDPLGKPAGRISKDENLCEVWSRELSDGTHAVALLNGAPVGEKITVKFSDLGLSGRQAVRDLWLHEDAGTFEGSYTVDVPSHGTVVLKIGSGLKSD